MSMRLVALSFSAISWFLHGASAQRHNLGRSQSSTIPKYPYDESVTKYCSWWLDNDGGWTCERLEAEFGLSLIDFHAWNPSVSLPCNLLSANQSFCIAASAPPWPHTTSNVAATFTVTHTASIQPNHTVFRTPAPVTVTRSVTTTATRHSISTAVISVTVPTTIISRPPPQRITTTRFATATIVTTVRVVSVTTTTVIAQRTVTASPSVVAGRNGIVTPVPPQPGMVTNCQTFYYVRRGDTCESIGARHRISPQQVVSWNPQAREDCTMLLADFFACVGLA